MVGWCSFLFFFSFVRHKNEMKCAGVAKAFHHRGIEALDKTNKTRWKKIEEIIGTIIVVIIALCYGAIKPKMVIWFTSHNFRSSSHSMEAKMDEFFFDVWS